MTWAEFKHKVEFEGVTDDMKIVSVSFIGKAIDENIELIVGKEDFSVYGVSSEVMS